MKITNLYNSNIQNNLRVDDAGSAAAELKSGDILEGLVTSSGKNTTVEFEQLNNKEITFDSKSVGNAYVGQKRRFEVIEATGQKLVLKDLGGVAAEAGAKGIISTKVDTNMPKMVEDFSETNGSKEEEDTDSIKRLSDEDYSELASEGFSIEDYKAERLIRALERIKTNRTAKRERIDEQSEKIKENGEKIKKQAAKAVSDKYAAHRNIVDRLAEADLPVTDENVNSIINAIAMSADAGKMSDNSMAYLIGRKLQPTVSNIYRSVYTGSIKRTEISAADWKNIEPSAKEIIGEASEMIDDAAKNAGTEAEALTALKLEAPTEEDARWFVEFNIPLNKENLVYKKELEELKANGRTEDEIAEAAAKAIERGEGAEEAVLIAGHDPSRAGEDGRGSGQGNKDAEQVEKLTAKLRLQEIRLSMTVQSRTIMLQTELEKTIGDIETEISALKDQIQGFYEALATEIGIDKAAIRDAVDTAEKTVGAVTEVATSSVMLYGMTYSMRNTITLAELADNAARMKLNAPLPDEILPIRPRIVSEVQSAIGRYEESATEVRRDLGDSINKAFKNVDSLLENENLELSEANRRAVRILGHNSMEITRENIENIKFYDAKVTRMIDGLKPAMVMSMIRRGYNPLEQDIDTINDTIGQIIREEGASEEEKFSTFLVRMDEANAISEQARAAYIGIYRLLYQIEKSDGAAIGAAVNSGRELTLENLLTEARSRQNTGIDVQIDDEAKLEDSVYVNSITDQILEGFTGTVREQVRYNLELAREAADRTDPAVWDEALKGEAPADISLEQLAEKLQMAENYIADDKVALEAENVRNVMSSGTSSGKFLKSLGIADSVNNISLLDREGEDLSLEFGNREELTDAIADPEALTEVFTHKEAEALSETEGEFLGNIAIITKGRELDETLKKYGLLSEMAKKDHYRMSTTGDTPARINLTVVHSTERAGTISLEVSTVDYHARADLSLTLFEGGAQAPSEQVGRIDGRISCDSNSELEAIATPLSSFITAMKSLGYDADDIGTGIDRISPDAYLSRLGELRRRAAETTAQVEESRRRPTTLQLYNIAKEFIANFI